MTVDMAVDIVVGTAADIAADIAAGIVADIAAGIAAGTAAGLLPAAVLPVESLAAEPATVLHSQLVTPSGMSGASRASLVTAGS